MQCYVYRSERHADTYVYLRERDGFGVLPPALAERLGALEFALQFELTPGRRLAREDAAKVLTSLETAGFHLQLPPPDPLTAAS